MVSKGYKLQKTNTSLTETRTLQYAFKVRLINNWFILQPLILPKPSAYINKGSLIKEAGWHLSERLRGF